MIFNYENIASAIPITKYHFKMSHKRWRSSAILQWDRFRERDSEAIALAEEATRRRAIDKDDCEWARSPCTHSLVLKYFIITQTTLYHSYARYGDASATSDYQPCLILMANTL